MNKHWNYLLKDTAETIKLFGYKLARLCLIVLLVLPVACVSKQMPENFGLLPVPGVNLSDEIILLDEATEKVVSCMTTDGWVHLVAITAKGKAYHIAVSERGIERREAFGEDDRYGYYNNLAIADDGLERLHVAIKNKHWIFEHGAWFHAGSNQCSLLARSGDSLACILDVRGSELKTPAQWGITGFGGGPAGILIPYRIRPSKLVLGSFGKEGWSYHAVINPRSPYFVNLETYDGAIMVSDSFGILHILYRAHSGSGVHVRYAASSLTGGGTPTIEWRRTDASVVELSYFDSVPVNIPQDWFIPFGGLTFAVDPLTGKGVFFARKSGGSWTDGIVEMRKSFFSKPTLLPFKDSRPKKLAPAGHNQFHTLVAIDRKLFYLRYGAEGWSEPTRLGEFGTPSLFLIGDSSIQLASNGKRNAMAIWPKREGRLVGRWITLDDMPQ